MVEELPVESQAMWKCLEEDAEIEKQAMLGRSEGNSSRGGVGWPSRAAESP